MKQFYVYYISRMRKLKLIYKVFIVNSLSYLFQRQVIASQSFVRLKCYDDFFYKPLILHQTVYNENENGLSGKHMSL